MQHQVKTIDANMLISYLSDNRIDKDLKNKIKKFFQPSNTGDIRINIFVYALGEVFKWFLEKRDGKKNFDLSDNKRQNILENLQVMVENGFVSVVRWDDISTNIFYHYAEIDKLDYKIQMGDKIALAAFCADEKSGAFYTNDSDILRSIKIREYINSLSSSKTIHEP